MKIKVIDIIEQIVDDRCDCSFRDSYSGRGMMGRTCLGIVCERPIDIIEEAAQRGITGAKMDSMGMQSIIYWPCYNADSEIDEVELVDVEYL